MQNVLAVFIFWIMNLAIQLSLYFIPIVKTFMYSLNPMVVIRVMMANLAIAILMYDVFIDVGLAKYLLYLILVAVIILTGGTICREPLFFIFIFSIMFGVMYLVCFLREGLGTKPCLACAPEQLHDNTPTNQRLDNRPPYYG